MKLSKKIVAGFLSLSAAVLLAACSSNANQGGDRAQSQSSQPASSSVASSSVASSSVASSSVASSSSSSSSQSASSNASQSGQLDGTYMATDHDGDQHRLEIRGTTGTWTETEVDGEQEVKQVQVDTGKQQLTVGNELKSYRQEGGQLIVDELDDDPDTLTFTKE
ncbi:hypothetical protein STRDD11_02285 [Streptococcus sp. DD11]|uniref:SP_0198 family lipoprotein n=1 Tax=Streptococcus sp. DD11 TaxID=1777879 RepID=UPI0007913B77|nr:SP_0198 family lipoprotein [Streptococcus sp. DD11]KXT79396.1 hypothetical protein STRDD11_02285 [Streptococcus sp. DD11]